MVGTVVFLLLWSLGGEGLTCACECSLALGSAEESDDLDCGGGVGVCDWDAVSDG